MCVYFSEHIHAEPKPPGGSLQTALDFGAASDQIANSFPEHY